MRVKFISLLVIATLISGCDSSDNSSAAKTAPPQVDVVSVFNQPVTLSTQLPGRTFAIRTAEVRPQVSGILLKRMFTEGADVKAGQQLYQIDPATYKAAVNKAEATWKDATLLAQRYRSLTAVQAVSKQDYDDAVARAQEAKAALDTARINLAYTQVNAPINGRIDRSLVTEGALVTNGQQQYLTTITTLDPIYVDISESSRNLLHLRHLIDSGMLKKVSGHEAAVNLILEDGTPYAQEGRLEFSEVRVDPDTGSVTLRATFPNPQHLLLPGMFVHAQLAQGVQDQAIMVPQSAVGHDNKGRAFVYVVDKNAVTNLRYIDTGDMINGQWVVNSGLNTGENVVVSNLQRVANGSKVQAHMQQTVSTPASISALSMTDPVAQ